MYGTWLPSVGCHYSLTAETHLCLIWRSVLWLTTSQFQWSLVKREYWEKNNKEIVEWVCLMSKDFDNGCGRWDHGRACWHLQGGWHSSTVSPLTPLFCHAATHGAESYDISVDMQTTYRLGGLGGPNCSLNLSIRRRLNNWIRKPCVSHRGWTFCRRAFG